MAHNLSGAKLSTNLGGGFKNDIFGGSAGVNAGKGFVPKFGAANGMIGKYGMGAPKSGTGGGIAARPSMGSKGYLMRGNHSSQSLARLRGMSPYNAQMRAGGTAGTEASAAAASAQWEASDVVGSQAPTSPTDAQTTPDPGNGPSGGINDPSGSQGYTPTVENCGDDQYWNGTSCTSANLGGTNVTPWQGLVNTCVMLKDIIDGLLFAAALIATIANKALDTICSFEIGYIIYGAAALMGLVAVGLSAVLASLGGQINGMGGDPNGTIFQEMAPMYAIAGVVDLLVIFYTGTTQVEYTDISMIAMYAVLIGTAVDTILGPGGK
jgi:hypothetical protein